MSSAALKRGDPVRVPRRQNGPRAALGTVQNALQSSSSRMQYMSWMRERLRLAYGVGSPAQSVINAPTGRNVARPESALARIVYSYSPVQK